MLVANLLSFFLHTQPTQCTQNIFSQIGVILKNETVCEFCHFLWTSVNNILLWYMKGNNRKSCVYWQYWKCIGGIYITVFPLSPFRAFRKLLVLGKSFTQNGIMFLWLACLVMLVILPQVTTWILAILLEADTHTCTEKVVRYPPTQPYKYPSLTKLGVNFPADLIVDRLL